MNTKITKHKNYILVEGKSQAGNAILSYAKSAKSKSGIKLAEKLVKELKEDRGDVGNHQEYLNNIEPAPAV